jgi:hypothetical protein
VGGFLFPKEHQSRYHWQNPVEFRTENRHWPPAIQVLAQLLMRSVTHPAERILRLFIHYLKQAGKTKNQVKKKQPGELPREEVKE